VITTPLVGHRHFTFFCDHLLTATAFLADDFFSGRDRVLDGAEVFLVVVRETLVDRLIDLFAEGVNCGRERRELDDAADTFAAELA
jgi:hypothetical protein